MDSADILDDKESGAEVQINFPTSVMNRIEEMMGGTEQFDSADFDAVAYINRVFPTEQSLSGVESAAARCEFHLAGVEQDIRRLVRAQAQQREAGQEALTDAQKCIAELALQVADINKKAERSESMVREITSEIKQLDCAKSNLTAAITALNHLHMLVGGVERLRELAAARRYGELAPPLQAVAAVLRHFERFRRVRRLGALRDAVAALRDALAAQIRADFRAAFTGAPAARPALSQRTLAEACAVVDILEPKAKRELLEWFVDVQLQEYEHLFAADQECAWVSHVERRYAWLKRHLLAFEDSLANIFPHGWRLSERIAHRFCVMTRAALGAQMESRRSELDVKLLLYAIQKTHHFELLLHKRFTGAELGAESADLPVDKQASPPADTADRAFPEAEAPLEDAEPSRGGSPWVGLIGSCFEPYLSLYISSLDGNLRSLMDRFIQDAKSPDGGEGAGEGGAGAGAGAVIASCADLFLFYKKCLVQCARLSTGDAMLELAGVFQKYLREYASVVLQARLPAGAGAGAGAGGAVPALVTNLHALLRDDGAPPAERLSRAERARITGVITTAEYCLETTVHLEHKLREKVAPGLADRIDLGAERDLFHKIIDVGIGLLVTDLELACEPALHAMARVAWAQLESVGDQSAYVTQIAGRLRAAVPELRDELASCRKYFTQVCVRFANSFVPKFTQTVYKCKPMSTVGAEQLLLDAHMLKTTLLELPTLGAPRRPAPAIYAAVVVRLMARAEMLLKLVMAPLDDVDAFAEQCARLLPDCSLPDLLRVLDLKAVRLSRAQLAALHSRFPNSRRL